MKFNEIFIITSILCFYHLLNEFIEAGGIDYNLLKIIMELIILLFIMIFYKYKKEIQRAGYFDKCQKKIDDFFSKNWK